MEKRHPARESTPDGLDAPSRESQVRPRSPTPTTPLTAHTPAPTPSAGIDRGLREVRKRAVTLRQQGWKWELQGRASAFREAADQVRRWLLSKESPTEADVRFVIKLLEQTAEVYEAEDGADKKK